MGSKKDRKDIAQDLLTSERQYVESLHTLVDVYVTPCTNLSKSADATLQICLPEDVPVLFSNVASLVNLSSTFVNDLDSRLRSWRGDTTCIGDVLCNFVPMFKMYQPYVANHSDAALRVQQLSYNDGFRSFLFRAQQDPRSNGRTIAELLAMPLNRAGQIHVFLQNLAQATPSGHPDYANLQRALNLIEGVLSGQDDAIKKEQNRAVVLSIEERFLTDPGFTAPGRELIAQGTLMKQCRSSDQEFTFFLFTDLLAYAKSLGGGWKYKLNRKIPIDSTFSVADLPDPNLTGRHYFLIKSKQKSFKVYASSLNTKQNWLQDLQYCIDRNRGNSGGGGGRVAAPPVLQQSSERADCPLCNMVFSLLKLRKNCKACGGLVCSDCSKNKAIIPGRADGKPHRVCDSCSDKLAKNITITPVDSASLAVSTSSSSSLNRSIVASSSRPAAARPVPVAPAASSDSRPEQKMNAMTNENGLAFHCERSGVMVNPSTRKEFVTYTISMEGHGFSVSATKRYSQFSDFDDKFRKHFPNIPYELPPKILFGHTNPLVVDERARAFVRYLSGISTVRALWKLLGEFLGAKESDWMNLQKTIDEWKLRPTSPNSTVPAPSPHRRSLPKPVNLPPANPAGAGSGRATMAAPVPVRAGGVPDPSSQHTRFGAKGPAPAIPARTYQAPMSPPSQTYSPSSSPPSTNSASVSTGSNPTVSSSTASTGYRAQPPVIPSTYQSQPVTQAATATAAPSGGLYTPTPPQSAPPPTMGTVGTGSAITRSVSPPPVPSYGNAGFNTAASRNQGIASAALSPRANIGAAASSAAAPTAFGGGAGSRFGAAGIGAAFNAGAGAGAGLPRPVVTNKSASVIAVPGASAVGTGRALPTPPGGSSTAFGGSSIAQRMAALNTGDSSSSSSSAGPAKSFSVFGGSSSSKPAFGSAAAATGVAAASAATSTPYAATAAKVAGLKARVCATYSPTTDSEISLREGAIIIVLDRSDEMGWWYGRDALGNEGYFPATYVQVL